MNESKNIEINKHLKTEAELYLTLKAKNCDYRAVECPIVYNLYSNGDKTLFIQLNGRTGLYDLYGSANWTENIKEYMPLNYGSKFDKLINGQYPEIHLIFKKLIRADILEIKEKSLNELYKSIKNTN